MVEIFLLGLYIEGHYGGFRKPNMCMHVHGRLPDSMGEAQEKQPVCSFYEVGRRTAMDALKARSGARTSCQRLTDSQLFIV